jgi:hypothetical protein
MKLAIKPITLAATAITAATLAVAACGKAPPADERVAANTSAANAPADTTYPGNAMDPRSSAL